MAFQFACPQGHLITADERQAGQQFQCPDCGQWVVIPGATAPPPESLPDDLLSELPVATEPSIGPAGSKAASQYGGGSLTGGMAQPHIMHIPCPNGHPLKTPIGMLGTRAVCPICKAGFNLKYESSIEYLEHQELLDEARFTRSGKIWLRVAIGFAILVVGGLVAAFVLSGQQK